MTPSPRPGRWEHAGAYLVRSREPKLWIVPTSNLPTIPYSPTSKSVAHDGGSPELCERIVSLTEPRTSAGRWARARGWRVAFEAPLGPLTATVLVRRYIYTFQGCWSFDGRIVLFDRDKPVATVITAPTELIQIGLVEPTERAALRVETISNDVPFGDLVFSHGRIEAEPLPPQDMVCDGRAAVPNVFGVPIIEASRVLRGAGWRPVPPPTSKLAENLGVAARYDKGLSEVTECTPMAVCGFQYRSRGIVTELSVIADGGSEFVYRHDENCSGRARRRQ
ncbi:hypothetical protein GCM10009087_25560 [Sphingomonas oligophenolica]|uniref:Uncharacterized protein n=2 Tax=Sphingomonas oligophenolica TaxID=301154 RepID=A0ABU9Y8A7_9SPHN